MFQCIETLGAGCLPEESMAELMKILDKLLNEYFLRAIKRGDKRKEEDYDEVASCFCTEFTGLVLPCFY